MDVVPEEWRNEGYTDEEYNDLVQRSSSSSTTTTPNPPPRRARRIDNVNRKAALDVLQWHRWTSTPLEIEWHPKKKFDARDVKQKMEFWNEPAMATLIDYRALLRLPNWQAPSLT